MNMAIQMLLQMLCRTLVNLKRTDSSLSRRQMKIWQNQSPLFCCSVKGHIFVDLLQIKDKFHCQESIIIHRISFASVWKSKERIIGSSAQRWKIFHCIFTDFTYGERPSQDMFSNLRLGNAQKRPISSLQSLNQSLVKAERTSNEKRTLLWIHNFYFQTYKV
jgi:hypothetical protein